MAHASRRRASQDPGCAVPARSALSDPARSTSVREPVSLFWPSSPSSSTRTRACDRDDRSFKAVAAVRRASEARRTRVSELVITPIVCTLAPSTEPSSRSTKWFLVVPSRSKHFSAYTSTAVAFGRRASSRAASGPWRQRRSLLRRKVRCRPHQASYGSCPPPSHRKPTRRRRSHQVPILTRGIHLRVNLVLSRLGTEDAVEAHAPRLRTRRGAPVHLRPRRRGHNNTIETVGADGAGAGLEARTNSDASLDRLQRVVQLASLGITLAQGNVKLRASHQRLRAAVVVLGRLVRQIF